VAVNPGFGPQSIEEHFDEAVAAAGVAEGNYVPPRADAAVIASATRGWTPRARRWTAPCWASPSKGRVPRRLDGGHGLFGGDDDDAHLRHRRAARAALRLDQAAGDIHGTDIAVLDATAARRRWRRSRTARGRRWRATAARRSCSAARAWPIWPPRSSNAWACRSSTAWAWR
jgi:hypothetical protein